MSEIDRITVSCIDWPPPEHVVLVADEVHLWRVPIGGAPTDDYAGIAALSPAERERARRFRFEADRRRFVGSHSALRRILGMYLGTQPQAVVFASGARGKPFLQDPPGPLRFNLTHSGEVALVAVSHGREVGVDLERVRPVPDMDAIAARFFSPSERHALERVTPGDRLRVFLMTWVLKEAYLKACGDGLLRKPEDFDVTIGVDDARLLEVRDRPGDETRWTLHRLDVGEGYVAALAAEGLEGRLRQ